MQQASGSSFTNHLLIINLIKTSNQQQVTILLTKLNQKPKNAERRKPHKKIFNLN